MAEVPRETDSERGADDRTSDGPGRGLPPSTPRWVKVFGIIALVVVLLVAFALFTGLGGPHGPGRHAAPSDPGGYMPSSGGHVTPGTSGPAHAGHTSRITLPPGHA